MVAVPDDTPYTTPEPSTVATDVAVLLHTPLPAASLNVVVDPAHKFRVPVIAPATGNELTVTIAVAATVPQPLVTV